MPAFIRESSALAHAWRDIGGQTAIRDPRHRAGYATVPKQRRDAIVRCPCLVARRRRLGPAGPAAAGAGDATEALRWLENAYDSRSDWLPWIILPNAYGGAVEPLRDEPRYRELVARLQLPAATDTITARLHPATGR